MWRSYTFADDNLPSKIDLVWQNLSFCAPRSFQLLSVVGVRHLDEDDVLLRDSAHPWRQYQMMIVNPKGVNHTDIEDLSTKTDVLQANELSKRHFYVFEKSKMFKN